uniref:EB domain-containing protein n=1 Tax=Romanomermis culicivorax TaxID=13658 RepID=A0A915J0B4_ROMCU
MKSFLCFYIFLNSLSRVFCELKTLANDTKYDFFVSLGGPVSIPAFYKKNETKQFYSKLGESCEWSDNCLAAYAICKMGKCACDGAFDEKDGICRPKTVYCPDPEGGDAKAISTPKFCHVEYLNSTISNIACSSGEFCFAHPISWSSPKNFFPSGHCCPLLTVKTKLSAPVCPLILKDDIFNGSNKNCKQCQPIMEQCVSFKVWNTEMAYTYIGRCCPLPCRDAIHSNKQLFNVDGQCFYHRKYVK